MIISSPHCRGCGFPARVRESLSRWELTGVVDGCDELGHRFVGGLDLAMDELRNNVLIGIGDSRRSTVTLGQRAEQSAACVGSLQVGDALLAASIEILIRNVGTGRNRTLDDVEGGLETLRQRCL